MESKDETPGFCSFEVSLQNKLILFNLFLPFETSDLQFLVNIIYGRVSDLSNFRHAQLLNLRDQLQAKVL